MEVKVSKMLNGKHMYAYEKFSQAVHMLATGAGDIRSRLLHAWQGPLWVLDADKHLPEDLRKDFVWIKEQLHRFCEEWPGQLRDLEQKEKLLPNCNKKEYAYLYPDPVKATLKRIRLNTGAKIAHRIYSIYDSLESKAR